jgi:gas vesicle protein
MAEDQSSHAGSIVVAFVLGAIAGAAIALLWAPAAGEETRRKLGERARESRDKASEAARHGREFLRSQRDHLSSAFERGKEAFDQARGPKEPT